MYVKAPEQLTERPLWIVRDAIPSKGGFTPAVQPHTGENTAQAAPGHDPALTAGQAQKSQQTTNTSPLVSPTGQGAHRKASSSRI